MKRLLGANAEKRALIPHCFPRVKWPAYLHGTCRVPEILFKLSGNFAEELLCFAVSSRLTIVSLASSIKLTTGGETRDYLNDQIPQL